MQHVIVRRVIVDINNYCDIFEKKVEELAGVIFWYKKKMQSVWLLYEYMNMIWY